MDRQDGRETSQLRPVRITPGYVNTAPGAVLMEMGETRVLCTVSIEERVPPFLVGKGKGWLTAEYGMLPGSSPQRVSRESATGRPNGRAREIQRLIGRSLRAAVDLKRVGERTLYVDCDVLQADGGTRTASITGAWVALVLAVRSLSDRGRLEHGDIITSQIAAVIDKNCVSCKLCEQVCIKNAIVVPRTHQFEDIGMSFMSYLTDDH